MRLDQRTPLERGAILVLGGRPYTIEELIGYGATSFVYSARYEDSLHPEKSHSVLIKEFFPYHPKGLIARDALNRIAYPEEAKEYFELRKRSFLRGNRTHIDLQNIRADMAGINIDSFEEHGGVYTILGSMGGETLRSILQREKSNISLSIIISWMRSLLDALDVFHKNGLLHLDISPENILLLPLDEGKHEKQRRIMLIDFNSVWSMEELSEDGDVYYSIKDGYSAPEVRLMESRSISFATDLFSVCAVLLELLQGSPMDFSTLYTGGRIVDPDTGLLKGAAPEIKTRLIKILRDGLKLPPNRRYQSIVELLSALGELGSYIEGENILKKASRLQLRRAVPIAAITLAIAFALSFVAIHLYEGSRAYPKTVQEINITNNAMTALAASLGKLGAQIKYDMDALEAYDDGYDSFLESFKAGEPYRDALTLNEKYSESSLNAYKSNGSPIRFDLLLSLLNAPDDYRAWSDAMLSNLQTVLPDARYPGEDRDAIVELYRSHIQAYSNACYIKMRLIVLPLSDEGKSDLLSALPYVEVFGERFSRDSFGGAHAELESALKYENSAMMSAEAALASYGMEASQ